MSTKVALLSITERSWPGTWDKMMEKR